MTQIAWSKNYAIMTDECGNKEEEQEQDDLDFDELIEYDPDYSGTIRSVLTDAASDTDANSDTITPQNDTGSNSTIETLDDFSNVYNAEDPLFRDYANLEELNIWLEENDHNDATTETIQKIQNDIDYFRQKSHSYRRLTMQTYQHCKKVVEEIHELEAMIQCLKKN